MTGTIDHVMIRVEDLDESLEWYKIHFNFVEVRDRTEANTFTNVFLAPEDKHHDAAYLELTFNHDGRTYDLGDGWGHICLRVDDLDDAYDRLLETGVEDSESPADSSGPHAYVWDPDGHKIQLVERDYGVQFDIDHVMWRATDADAAVGWFTRKFDYELVNRVDREEFESFFMAPQNAVDEEAIIELRYERGAGEYTIGDAWGHIAIRVDDLHETWDTLMRREAADYRPPETCNNEYAFTKFADGHEIDLHPH